MTASEISRLLHGKRLGHGKYLAKCPAHDDSKPSLSIRSGRKAVLLKCWPGCTVEEIVRSMGLKMSDLWYSKESITPEISQRLKDERRLEDIERIWGLAMWLRALEPQNHYWEVLEWDMREKRKELIFRLYPERKQAYDLQVRIRSLGWDRMWEEYLKANPRVEKANPIVQKPQTMLFPDVEITK